MWKNKTYRRLHLKGRVLHGTTFLHSPFTIIFVLTSSVSVRYMQKYLLRFKGERKTHGLGSNRLFHDVKHKFKGKLLPSAASFSCVTQLCVLSYHGYTSHSSDDSSLLSAVQLKCILHVTDHQYPSKSNTYFGARTSSLGILNQLRKSKRCFYFMYLLTCWIK